MRVLIVVIMGRWSGLSTCGVCHVVRLYIVMMPGDVVFCSVVCCILVGVFFFCIMCSVVADYVRDQLGTVIISV